MMHYRLGGSRPRHGLVAALVAVCLLALMGIVAIAVDGGMLMAVQRRVSMAADASALAAAVDLAENYSTNHGTDPNGTAAKSAQTTAKANGFTSSNATITVNIPPKSGPFAGNTAGYVEVIVQYNQPRLFSAIWGKSALPVAARAVARGQSSQKDIAMLVLDPNKQGAIGLTGNGKVVAGGMIVVDSTSSGAISLTGNANVSAPTVDIVGSPGISSTGHGSVTGSVNAGSSSMSDPLSSLPAPSLSSLTVQSSSQLTIRGTQTLNPGVYVGGISASSQANVTLNAGIYYMEGGGLSLGGQASVTGNGVMIYNDGGGAISLSGGGSLTLTPPTSGTYAGITIYQNRTSTTAISITGNGSTNVQGTIYAADANINLRGGGGLDANGNPLDSLASQVIADSISITGNGSFSVGGSNSNSTPTYDIRLVE
ncbi:MAG TPA: pilus assembly protein TadG-related protein [Gemmataceae bacterium]|nr:pilus assembly protein TadG-related protein [Gemmataceae bacterium]